MTKSAYFLVFLRLPFLCCGWSTLPSPLSSRSRQADYDIISRTKGHSSLGSTESASADESTNKSANSKTRRNGPWQNARWKITFDFGREEGSWMPEEWAEWGKEGGRLVLSPLEVEITSDRPTGKEDPMLRRNAWIMQPLSKSANYITMKGQQQALFGNCGGWKIRMPWSGTSAGSSSSTVAKLRGHASKLMCFVDLVSDIAKGDVKLSKGERIYMTGKCWREDDLENALKTMYPIRANFLEAQARLEAQLEHETGDRRLDGTDPIQTIMGMKDTAQLVIQRDEAMRNYDDARSLYPSFEDDSREYSTDDIPLEEGPWPGQLEWLSIQPGYLLLRRSSFLNEEYHVIGKWKAEPIFDENDGDEVEASIF